jgi:hypothetical protein
MTFRQYLSRLIWNDDYKRLQECAKCFSDMLEHINTDTTGQKVDFQNVRKHAQYLSEQLLPFVSHEADQR